MTSDYGIPDTALEQRVAEMSDTDFEDLVSRTRPHTANDDPITSRLKDLSDPADRHRAITASINAKQQRSKQRGPVNANGYRTGPVNASPGLNPVLPTDTTTY